MPAKVARTGAVRRSVKRKAVDVVEPAARLERSAPDADPDDWEGEQDSERLQEGEMEMLLTGHAATHGIEGEDNWLIESEEDKWGER